MARISTSCIWPNERACSSTSAPKPTEKSAGAAISGIRAATAVTASLSVVSISALTRTIRSWFLRSICSGPESGRTAITLRAGITSPVGVLSGTSLMSAVRSRSSSRRRTTMGYSSPRSR